MTNEQAQNDCITQLARIDRARNQVLERWLERADDAVRTERAMEALEVLHKATNHVMCQLSALQA